MNRSHSTSRTLTGLGLATVVAPVTTAISLNIALMFTLRESPVSFPDLVGGAVSFILLAAIFGAVLAVIPTFVLGGISVAIARSIGTRSPIFFTAAGLVGGLAMAWVDVQRSGSVFAALEAIPFLLGGCASALVYWSVAER